MMKKLAILPSKLAFSQTLCSFVPKMIRLKYADR